MKPKQYGLSKDLVLGVGTRTSIAPYRVAVALDKLIRADGLSIDEYLDQIDVTPFFLVAATGLGKTVVVPPHVWLRHCARVSSTQTVPRLWVVEPRVLIADEQAVYMTSLLNSMSNDRRPLRVFGSVTSKGVTGRNNPIQFVTTGVFTAKAFGGDFEPEIDAILVDEAHETIAQDPNVELAVAICVKRGIPVSYMSATVDTSSIPHLLGIQEQHIIAATKQRYPIYVANVGRPMTDSIAEIISDLLLKKNPDSPLLPSRDDPLRAEVIEGIYGGEPRAHGLLIAVNSVSGAQSDIASITRQIRVADLRFDGRPLSILTLSATQTSSPREMENFNSARAAIDAQLLPYVVIATSVIEMGVTISTLDFVVTMDSAIANKVVGDRTVPVTVPLPFNSLKQRLGRVGRRRAGVGLITREIGASYTFLDATELNGDDLQYEPVRTPLRTASLLQLAYYTYQQGWASTDDVAAGLAGLTLPSRQTLISVDRLKDLVEERRFLARLGLVDTEGRLTESGNLVGPWIGDGYLPYAIRLQQAIVAGEDQRIEALFWTVALAASEVSLSDLMKRRVSLEEMTGLGGGVRVDAADLAAGSELVALYLLVAKLGRTYGAYVGEDTPPLTAVAVVARESFYRLAQALGMEPDRIVALLKQTRRVISRIRKINKRHANTVNALFGPALSPALSAVPWPNLDLDTRVRLEGLVHGLPGRPLLRIDEESRGDLESVYHWTLNGERVARVGPGVVGVSDPSRREAGYTARLQLLPEVRDGYWLSTIHHAEAKS